MSEENNQNQQETAADGGSNADFLSGLQGLSNIDLKVKVLLGKIKMPIGHYLKITRGSIVELDKMKSENLDILVNEHKVAEGEIVISEPDRIAVEVIKVHKPKKF